MEIVHKAPIGWYIGIRIEDFKSLLEHEENLYSKYITPEYLIESIKSYTNNRPFDNEGFSLKEAKDYFSFMNGKSLQLLALLISRKVRKNSHINYLEFGRSLGGMGVYFQKLIKSITIDIVFDKRDIEVFEEQIYPQYTTVPRILKSIDERKETNQYHLICVYNTIHYYKTDELFERFIKLKQYLSAEGLLCIMDIFLDERPQNSLYTLDWITHGGIYHLTLKEIESILLQAGLVIVKTLYHAETSMDILLIRRN